MDFIPLVMKTHSISDEDFIPLVMKTHSTSDEDFIPSTREEYFIPLVRNTLFH